MKTFILTAAIAFGANAAFAGSPATPIVEPVVIAAEAAESSAPSGGLVLGLMTVLLFGTAASN